MRRTLLLALLLAATSASRAAAGTPSPEQQLAEKYAPVVGLKQLSSPCASDGEQYRPVPVDVVLGRPDVRLLDGHGRLLRTAPTASQLYGRGEDTYLDLPGNPLNPGCSYAHWANRVGAGSPTTAYAHVVRQRGKPGQLALQYWLYYVFNDFNNKHESDWEMIQLMFPAATAAEALTRRPTEVGYSQHSGAERAAWSDSKLQRRGLHPIVYPGAGSHANYFSQGVWLGANAQEGFGCDDTRSPSRLLQTHVVLLPASAPISPTDRFAWLAYRGHWGQQAGGPNNGPTGPNMKTQWTQPATWAADDWRAGSSAVPLTGTVGPSATSFFCGAVAAGSRVYLRFLRTPWLVLGVLLGVVLLGVWLGRRTRWSPADAVPVDTTRAGGQIYRAAGRLYRSRMLLFLGVGLVFVPLGILAVGLQQLVFHLTGIGALVTEVDADPVVAAAIALLFGQLSTIVASVLVTAAAAAALDAVDRGERVNVAAVAGRVVPHVGALARAWLRIVVVAGLLTVTIVGIPFAVVYLVRRAVVTQACVIEDLHAIPSLRRSSELVRRHGPRVLAISALVNVTSYLLGPIAGVLVLFLTSSSLAVVNLVSSLVYTAVVPYAGIAIAMLFYDLRRRLGEEAPAVSPYAIVAPTASH